MLSIILLSCVLIGIVVGFLSGLLGIGGGLIIVPALVYLLPLLDLPMNVVLPLALGTSLCSIVVTSSAATLSHYKNGNIPWLLTKKFIVAISLGSLSGALVADLLSVIVLKLIFSAALIPLALNMLFFFFFVRARPLPNDAVIFIIAYACGVLASLMGISGAVILIPILTIFGVSVRHAIGLATMCGALVAAFGSAGYIISGIGVSELPPWSMGYVYLPALIAIVITSTLFAPFGVQYANKLPVKTLKRLFSFFLLIVALKMIFS